jgi:hypothetical protein
MINFTTINTFEGGNSKDLTENVEKKNTFIKGLNGRIYSKNGVFSFASIKGSKLAYQNTDIVKWLGSYSFRDEAIVFAKCRKPVGAGEGFEQEITENIVSSESSEIIFDVNPGVTIQNTDGLILAKSSIIESTYTVVTPVEDPTDFNVPYSDIQEETATIDFGEYFEERMNVADFNLCNINLNQLPINNLKYYDTIISFTLNDEGILSGQRIWTGAQNWPMEGKITCEGVEENEFYKRVYYSDAVNPRRVMNRKDTSLSKRNPEEFNQILNNVLLQPEIKSIENGGQLKAMKSLYLYRIISEQGQVSEFSPFSFYANIVAEDDGIRYRGGDISETTGKMVKVQCNIINPELSSEIECIALEFEAKGPPTAIKNLGIKRASTIVEFQHFGNEPEFIDDITINDILEFKNTWKYCNDFTSKKNKLIAAGLRNNPIPTQIQNLEYLFPLHSWKKNGETFETLMNPEPWEYRYIDPTNTRPLIYVKQKKYETLSSFGPCTLSLTNKLVDLSIELSFPLLTLENYSDLLPEVIDWLVDKYENDTEFNILFPNLKITNNDGQLLFSPIDSNIKTDLSNYIFESNNEQFIQNFKNDIVFLSPSVSTSKMVHGAESIGFNQGNGVRVTYKEFKEPLMQEANAVYNGTGKILDFNKPSGETYCMKGEIYRLAFQAYDLASSRYFSISMGDLMIPEIGDIKSSIDNQGNPVITSKKYVNQSVENGVLYGHGIKMHIEVRLSCEMQQLISMYQILYVERTEDNRTILCQGIAAPLNRVQTNNDDHHQMPTEIENKWNLPYYGGPAYEKFGLNQYDQNGENYNYQGDGELERVITNRRLMYFDSPDLYFNKISDQYLASSRLNVIAKLNTDHSSKTMMNHGGYGRRNEIYPKFSRKILEDHVDGNTHVEGLPRAAREDRRSGTHESYFINVSVFSNYLNIPKKEFIINNSRTLKRGEMISGDAFDIDHDVSNNAVILPCMPWFFSAYQRRWDDQQTRPRADLFGHAITSPGYKTTIIRTSEDLFTDSFIGPDIHTVRPEIRLGGHDKVIYDTYPLINIYRNNRVSVYGGRTEQAYSRNTYIPLSRTIPVSKNTGVQTFDCGADTYITLNIRTKNDASNAEIEEIEFDNHGSGLARGEITTWLRHGAWNYVTVLETQVEPKLTYGYEFYRESGSHKFDILKTEHINEAYFNQNNLKQFIPKPFKFKDDPNLGNIIAVSNVKLSGENYDSWTMFKPNNFYPELEKNKGDVSNIIRYKEQIYAIQEDQTSLIHIGTDRIVNDADGNPINIKQGSGQVVEGHQILSQYGTSIRRAVVVSDFGFSFFDEKHVEFIKIDKPLLAANLLHLDFWDDMKHDRVVDTEAFFDHKYKETNIRIRCASGKSILISYNEMLQVFNGEYEYNNDHYISFDNKLYAPVNGMNHVLHQLNEGYPLHLFGKQRLLKIKGIIASDVNQVFLYKKTGIITNLKYPVKSIEYKTSLDQERIVLSNHNWYKIREGNHSVPAKNDTTDHFSSELDDLRGNWISVEITAESLYKNKVNILALINNLRVSHQ